MAKKRREGESWPAARGILTVWPCGEAPAPATGRPARETGCAVAAPSPASVAAGRARCHRPALRSPTAAQDRLVLTRADPSGSGSLRPGPATGAAIFPLRTPLSGAPARSTGQHRPACPRPSSDRPRPWRERVRRRCRSRSGLLPLHRLRVDVVVLSVAAEEPDHQHARLIL